MGATVVPDSWEEPVQEATANGKSVAEAVKDEHPAENALLSPEDLEKKAKRLAKILAGIERLEEKQQQGQALSAEESDKMKRKPEVERELRELHSSNSAAATGGKKE